MSPKKVSILKNIITCWNEHILGCHCCLVAQSCLTLCNPMDCSIPGFPVLYYLLEFVQTYVLWISDAIQPSLLCHPLLLLSSIFPSIRIFSNESAVCTLVQTIRPWASAAYLPMNIQVVSFRIDWFDLLTVQGLSRVISSTTVWKRRLFGTQHSLWSNSQIHICLLEKP